MRNLFYYLYTIIVVLYIYSLFGDKSTRTKRESVACNIIAFILIILVALRREDIGIDTPRYYLNFLFFNDSDSIELGYRFLSDIIKKCGLPFFVITSLESIIYILPVNYLIKNYSKNVFMSYFLFISFDYFFISMTALRQGIALGISFCILIMILKQRTRFFSILFIPLVFLFHKSAMVIMSYYFFPVLKHNKFLFSCYVFSFLILYVTFDFLQTYMLSLARIEYSDMFTGGLGSFVFFIIVTVLAVIYLERNNIANSFFINMMLLTLWIYPLLRFNPALFRLHYYFSIALIILVPNVLHNINNLFVKIPIFLFVLSVALYYAWYYAYSNFDVIPYYFCWETGSRISIYWLIHEEPFY